MEYTNQAYTNLVLCVEAAVYAFLAEVTAMLVENQTQFSQHGLSNINTTNPNLI